MGIDWIAVIWITSGVAVGSIVSHILRGRPKPAAAVFVEDGWKILRDAVIASVTTVGLFALKAALL